MRIQTKTLELKLQNTFKLANSSSDIRKNVFVQIDEGKGEAPLPPYYPDTVETVQKYIRGVQKLVENSQIEDFIETIDSLPDGCATGRCAVDVALHDLAAQSRKLPLNQFLGLSGREIPETSFTIAIDAPEKMAAHARNSKLPILKIKLGEHSDLEIVKAVRMATKARLRLDANGGWSREEAARLIPLLAEYDIEFIEQPVARDDVDGFKWLRKRTRVPLFADESLQNEKDLENLAGGVDGVVIKIMKTGGIRGAIRTVKAARAKGLKIMLSCMIESSLGVTAAAHLAGLADYIDLDGPLLIKNDPFEGIVYDKAKIILPSRPGLGVIPRTTKA